MGGSIHKYNSYKYVPNTFKKHDKCQFLTLIFLSKTWNKLCTLSLAHCIVITNNNKKKIKLNRVNIMILLFTIFYSINKQLMRGRQSPIGLLFMKTFGGLSLHFWAWAISFLSAILLSIWKLSSTYIIFWALIITLNDLFIKPN